MYSLSNMDLLFIATFVGFLFYLFIKKYKKNLQNYIVLNVGKSVDLSSKLCVKNEGVVLIITIKNKNKTFRHYISRGKHYSTNYKRPRIKISSFQGTVKIEYGLKVYDLIIR